MRQSVVADKIVCDFCESAEAYSWNACLGCKKDCCRKCMETGGTYFCHGVYVRGSGDGFYCSPCITRLSGIADPLLGAYMKIERLRLEAEAFGKDFEARKKAAEADVLRLRGDS